MANRVEIKVAKEGEAMLAEEIGEINVTSNKGVHFNLKKILYAAKQRENLVVLFSGSVADLKKYGKLLATAHLWGNLYELELVHIGQRVDTMTQKGMLKDMDEKASKMVKLTVAPDVKFDVSCFPDAVMSQEDNVSLTIHFPLEQEG